MLSEDTNLEPDVTVGSAPPMTHFAIDFTSIMQSLYPSIDEPVQEIFFQYQKPEMKFTKKLFSIMEKAKTNEELNIVGKHCILLLQDHLKEPPSQSNSQKQYEFLTEFLDFLRQYHHTLGAEHLKKIFTFKNQMQYDILKTVVSLPDTLAAHFMYFIEEVRFALGQETVQNLLTQNQQNHWNVLQIATRHNSEAASTVLTFLVQHYQWLGLDVTKTILSNKNHCGANALQVAIQYQPNLAMFLLDFFETQATFLGKDLIWSMLTNVDFEKWNAISLSLFKRPEVSHNIVKLLMKPETFFDDIQLNKTVYINHQECILEMIELLIIENPELLLNWMTVSEVGANKDSDINDTLIKFLFAELTKLDLNIDSELKTLQYLATKQYQMLLHDTFFSIAKGKPLTESIKQALFIAYETKIAHELRQESYALQTLKYYFSWEYYSPQVRLSAFNSLKRHIQKNEKINELISLFPEFRSGPLGEIYKLCSQDYLNQKTNEPRRKLTL